MIMEYSIQQKKADEWKSIGGPVYTNLEKVKEAMERCRTAYLIEAARATVPEADWRIVGRIIGDWHPVLEA